MKSGNRSGLPIWHPTGRLAAQWHVRGSSSWQQQAGHGSFTAIRGRCRSKHLDSLQRSLSTPLQTSATYLVDGIEYYIAPFPPLLPEHL